MMDATGFYGGVFHYAHVFFFVGTAMMIFLYLWWNGKLDMNENPARQMMHDEEDEA